MAGIRFVAAVEGGWLPIVCDDVRTADVWVLSDGPVERVTLLASKDEVRVRRIAGLLPTDVLLRALSRRVKEG